MRSLVAVAVVVTLLHHAGATMAESAAASLSQEEATGDDPQTRSEDITTHPREKITVVAPPILQETRVDRYAGPVAVVTSRQIEDLNAQDLPSALRRTPGVVISRHNPVGSFGGGEGGAVFIRGQGSSRPGAEIQMLMDGVPRFASVWTHPLMDHLSVDVVDRMEVYKGAQPVLFGNMAFGAVSVSTKRREESGHVTRLKAAYGSYNTPVESFEHGGRTGAFDYYFVQSYRRSDGHRDKAGGELQNYFGRVGYELSDRWDLSLVVNRTHGLADDPGPADGSYPPEGTFETGATFAVATFSNQQNWGEGDVKIYLEDGGMDWTGQYNATTRENDEDTLTDYANYGVRVRQMFRFGGDNEILAGLDVDPTGGEVLFVSPPLADQRFPREVFRIVSPYAAVSRRFELDSGLYVIPSAGLRYYEHNRFVHDLGAQAGLILGKGHTELHALYSKGTNYPGIFVKVFDDIFLPGNNRWQDLEPERVHHYELGISQSVRDLARLDVSLFFDRGRDRIVISPPPPFPPTWANIGRYSTSGIEGSLALTPRRDLDWFTGFTYMTADPKDLPYVPEWTASLGMNYRVVPDLQLSLDALYVSGQLVFSRARNAGAVNTEKVDPYVLLNARIAYEWALASPKTRVQLFLAGENLTGAQYEQKKGYPMPGANAMFGLSVSF